MNTIAWVVLVALLAFGSGCAKPDWIQQTLVTVDVTGTWRSTGGHFFELALEQQGPHVKGSFKTTGYNQPGNWRPLDGKVAGDVFSFQLTDGQWTGELTVTADEMSGEMRGTIPGAFARRQTTLQRVSSSPPPRSQ
jgi:hypothetical protein